MKENNIYLKYKKELTYVKEIMNDQYLYDLWYNYGFYLDKKFIQLDSNINIYEACFISLLTQKYIDNFKKNRTKLNILEIGLAYGTSSIVILNKILDYKGKKEYDIIDPNQTKQWNKIGINHIYSYLNYKNKNIDVNLYEEYSQIKMPLLHKKYDIIFIDGSHDEKIVIQDLINSDKLLKKDGLVILDDVRHEGVKNALQIFLKEYNKNYKKIIFDSNFDFKLNAINKYIISDKKDIHNPNTMYCFQKII